MTKKFLSVLLSVVTLITAVTGAYTSAYAVTYDPSIRTVQAGVEGVNNDKSIEDYEEFNLKRGDFIDDDSFVIPGLSSTVSYNKTDGYTLVDTMIPQGMCKVGKFTLITAYDSTEDTKTVIYVLDEYHTLVKTLIMPDTHHAGGIAYDSVNKMILISKSSKKTVSGLSYGEFTKLMKSPQTYIRFKYTFSSAKADKYPPSASGVTYYDGYVYVFSFGSGNNSYALCYTPSWNSESGEYSLKYKYKLTLPNWTQGITVCSYNYEKWLFVSVSYGRSESKPTYCSYLYTYSFEPATGRKTIDNVVACPPMLEQTYVSNDKLYCLFESGGKLYRKVNKCPLSMAMSLELSNLCAEKQGSVIDISSTNVNDGKQVNISSNLKGAKLYYSTGSIPYISRSTVASGRSFKTYVKDVTSPIYAVAVKNGKIVATDYIYITVKQAKTPTELTLVKKKKTYVKFRWTKSSGASGYYVYRATKKNGKYTLLATITGNKAKYTDLDVKAGKKYYYKIKAYKKGYRNSDFSATLYVKTPKEKKS